MLGWIPLPTEISKLILNIPHVGYNITLWTKIRFNDFKQLFKHFKHKTTTNIPCGDKFQPDGIPPYIDSKS
jgi:hypothetical protein